MQNHSSNPQTRNEQTFGMSEDSNTSKNDTKLPEKPRKMKFTGTKFTTKSPSQSVEDTLASMGMNIKGEIIFGIFPVLLALQAKRRMMHQLMYKSGSGNISDKIQSILTIAKEQGVPITSLKPSQFKLIFQGDQVHQGVCCDASPLSFVTLDEDHPEQQGEGELGRHQTEEERKQQGKGEQESSQAGKRNQEVGEQGSHQAWQEGKQQGEGEEESRHAERKMHQIKREQESQQAEEKKHEQGDDEQISQAGRKKQESDKYIHQEREKHQLGEEEQKSHQAGRERKQKLWLYLDQIQDPMNFGAVLRSAYFMGVDRVLTSETSSTRITSTVSKASAGVAEVFPVHQVKDPVRLASSLTRAGWELVSSASLSSSGGGGGGGGDDAGLTDVTAFHPQGNVLLIVGNEGKGISPELQQMCQMVLTITPGRSLHPHLQCLNVSVATALLLHGLHQRLSPHGP